MTVTLRPVRDDDRELLFLLYSSTREEELRVVDWPEEAKRAFLRQQFEAQDAHYRERYPGASLDLVLLDGEPVGRLYVARWPAEIRIMDIVLLPEHCGKGIGTGLLRRVLAEGDESGRKVSIHVETFNPARRLYDRLGFEPAGEHGVYVLMERSPGATAQVKTAS